MRYVKSMIPVVRRAAAADALAPAEMMACLESPRAQEIDSPRAVRAGASGIQP